MVLMMVLLMLALSFVVLSMEVISWQLAPLTSFIPISFIKVKYVINKALYKIVQSNYYKSTVVLFCFLALYGYLI